MKAQGFTCKQVRVHVYMCQCSDDIFSLTHLMIRSMNWERIKMPIALIRKQNLQGTFVNSGHRRVQLSCLLVKAQGHII